MYLKKNDKIIDFELTDYLGNRIKSSDYKGQKVYLSFFRGASCPFCNLRVHQLIKNYSKFEANKIQIITFFAATKEEINKYAGKQNAPFTIIPDPNPHHRSKKVPAHIKKEQDYSEHKRK